MASQIQGEGDRESARRYNDETQKFVADRAEKGKPIEGSAADASDKLTPAEQTARTHAKSASQDQRDAKILSDLAKR